MQDTVNTLKVLEFIGFILLVLVIAAGVLLYKGSIPTGVVDARYSSRASQFLITDEGTRIHYRIEGNRRGRPLVLLHGSGTSLHTFEPWVEILGDDYQLITLDLPGHGLTGAVSGNDYSGDAFLKVIDDVANHLELKNFVLGGNSMGGGLSWQYALAYPEKVDALILIDSVGLPVWNQEIANSDSGEEKETAIVFKLLSKPWFRAIATKLDPYYIVKQGVEVAYNHSPVVTDDLIQRYCDMALRQGTREATMARFASYKQLKTTPSDLATLTRPTLVMWGEDDALIDFRYADKFMEVLPNATMVAYKGVGHIPMEEIPEKSAADVIKFLESLPKE